MDKYEKIKIVGRGAYGTVYLCRRLADRQEVIIKQIPVDQMSKQQRISALNEVIVLSMLNHPNITRYYENFLEDKALMIVMEYAEGGTVFDYLQQRDGKLLSEEEILRFFVQILLSLQHVHSRQILHRDLKTQNLLLDSKKQVVKISDFGISKVMSKSKALTVVGTPCYISPELCESKPYNQKSDIWSLGCVLFELATLQRAFEAPTLPALILKIMRGSIAPIDARYSSQLRQLLADMLQVEPTRRPSAAMLLASPLLLGHLIAHTCDFGALPCIKHIAKSQSRKGAPRSRRVMKGLNEVFIWGVNNNWQPCPLPLPSPHTQITQVSLGRTQRAGVSKSGRVVLWETMLLTNETTSSVITSSQLQAPALPAPSSLSSPPTSVPSFTSSYMEGQSSISITQVSCGHLYTALLTDRGILMTYGCGSFGCLGHGDYKDVSQAKIVEALLGYEVLQVSAGNSHVIVLTSDNEVFTWGRGDNGRLGLGGTQTQCTPQQVFLPGLHTCTSVHAGVDRSIITTKQGCMLVTGSNRCNKLALNPFPQTSIFSHQEFPPSPSSSSSSSSPSISEVTSFTLVATSPLCHLKVHTVAIGMSHTALITSDGDCWCFGSNRFKQLGLSLEAEFACVQMYFFSVEDAGDDGSGGRGYGDDSGEYGMKRYSGGRDYGGRNCGGRDGGGGDCGGGNANNNEPGDRKINVNKDEIEIVGKGAVEKDAREVRTDKSTGGKSGQEKADIISCGDAFSVVSLKDGSLWSWGKSGRGRLGREGGLSGRRKLRRKSKIATYKVDNLIRDRFSAFYQKNPNECRDFLQRYVADESRPGKVDLQEAGTVVSLCCNHGSTIVVVRSKD